MLEQHSLSRFALACAATATLALVTGIAPPLTPVASATCGGGGGGGSKTTYTPTWAPSASAALKKAARFKQGALLYFMADGKAEHPFFTSKSAQEWSKERAFVKIAPGAEPETRKRHGVDPSLHGFVVVDGYGNALKTYAIQDGQRISEKSLGETLFGAAGLVKRLKKKLDKAVKSAEGSLKKAKYRKAIASAREAAAYEGYEQGVTARALLETIEEAGQKLLDEATALEDAGARSKRLKQLIKEFEGTAPGDRARAALEESSSTPVDPSDRRVSLAEQVWQEVYGAVRFEERAPSLLELADAALRRGLVHELAGRYEEALSEYAISAGLDPEDSVALVHLGELYRHHLGLWDEARRCFERVIEQDSHDQAVAVALHGIGKMTIWGGDSEAGLALFHRSIERYPTPLCYRNLAVYWNTEDEPERAFDFASKAFELDPKDSYNQVFYSVYLLLNGQEERSQAVMASAEFDLSMSYNYACYYAIRGERAKVMTHLKRHFQDYERYDEVRAFEMGEARMDGFFEPWFEDEEFKALTALAGNTPWLRGE
ncbi:MAG: tetratricopeptide repeat protein [Planctomycetota bacterium]|jgi:tetratricopeptide (TPR) repeat protein